MLTAVFLLITGIFTLRGSRTRRLFYIYAPVRIALAVISGFAWFTLIDATTASGHSAGPAAAATTGCLAAAISLIFPVIVLILLQLRSVRDYFAADGRPASNPG